MADPSLSGVEMSTLVDRLHADDASALRDLYVAYAQRLADFCFGALGDWDTAAAAVQDTMLVAWASAGRLRDPALLRAWLYGIARRECSRRMDGAAPQDTSDIPGHSPARIGLAALSAHRRDLLDLAARHELTGPEIAAIFGIPERQVPIQVARARAAYRAQERAHIAG
ncbi:MAG: RNA polymerase sigma factor [Mycobacteriaceae bacterium]|nr:RNA polymerase sigma factor [Mycobacteriaceae bacterium]